MSVFMPVADFLQTGVFEPADGVRRGGAKATGREFGRQRRVDVPRRGYGCSPRFDCIVLPDDINMDDLPTVTYLRLLTTNAPQV
jgi:hypothetical protein